MTPVAMSPVKRVFDVLFAAIGLALSSPIWLVLAVAITIEDGGPVFFRQERSGLGGRRFVVTKFRSMAPHDERGVRQAVRNDPRVTRVGRVMRATALDELPQLWNIFKGDMSVVGPRALHPAEIEAYGSGRAERLEDVPGFALRSSVRPGLTGVAQLYAARNLPRRRKFRYDRLYIRRQSITLDLRLIVLSVWVSIFGRWGRRGRQTGRHVSAGEPANRA